MVSPRSGASTAATSPTLHKCDSKSTMRGQSVMSGGFLPAIDNDVKTVSTVPRGLSRCTFLASNLNMYDKVGRGRSPVRADYFVTSPSPEPKRLVLPSLAGAPAQQKALSARGPAWRPDSGVLLG